MYGFIHCALEDLVTKKFGPETWKTLLKTSGITMHGASFLMHKVYTDEMTLKLVAAACEVLGLDLDTCLEAFGEHFLYFCRQHGYDHILRVLGSNMADFLTNLDNLHDHLASTYPGMQAPSFRVTPGPSGQILLHYYSDRKGLHPIVLGIVKVVGREFFNTEVCANISVVSEFGDKAHVTIEVTEKETHGKSCLLPSNASESLSNRPEDLPIGVRTMCTAFPFHVLFGNDFSIVQAGNGLLRLAGHRWKENRERRIKFDDIFEITRPVIECTFESIRSYCNQVFVVQTKEGLLKPRSTAGVNPVNTERENNPAAPPPPVLRLKGQMVSVEETHSILFLCSPRVKDIDDMQRMGLFFSDLAIHDPARELILRSHHHRGERELIEKLDEATNRLRMLQSKLDEDKKRTEELLHAILPAKVAKLLCQNLPVEAEKFETVSCLFSDIVGFTNMCGSCVPMDIVRLLNKLYLQFDNLSHIHGVYKVETIGDAYVVVAGVPDFFEDHADRLVIMGLDMISATKTVVNPVSGEPIQMRIGIHTGYATAGVVGKTMPRYCLFGNTVTLANKTESLSKPSRVNITEVARRHLTKQHYVFEDNLDVGDFPLQCYLVDIASRNTSAGQPTAADQQSANDSMLLSPSSSPVRRASAVTTPSLEGDEIGMFIKSRLNGSDAQDQCMRMQIRRKNEEVERQKCGSADREGPLSFPTDISLTAVPDGSSALSSVDQMGEHTIGSKAEKNAAENKTTSLPELSWTPPHPNRPTEGDSNSTQCHSNKSYSLEYGPMSAIESSSTSNDTDAIRQPCPFSRFREDGIAFPRPSAPAKHGINLPSSAVESSGTAHTEALVA